jgi:hypothetical protein
MFQQRLFAKSAVRIAADLKSLHYEPQMFLRDFRSMQRCQNQQACQRPWLIRNS